MFLVRKHRVVLVRKLIGVSLSVSGQETQGCASQAIWSITTVVDPEGVLRVLKKNPFRQNKFS